MQRQSSIRNGKKGRNISNLFCDIHCRTFCIHNLESNSCKKLIALMCTPTALLNRLPHLLRFQTGTAANLQHLRDGHTGSLSGGTGTNAPPPLFSFANTLIPTPDGEPDSFAERIREQQVAALICRPSNSVLLTPNCSTSSTPGVFSSNPTAATFVSQPQPASISRTACETNVGISGTTPALINPPTPYNILEHIIPISALTNCQVGPSSTRPTQ